MSRNMFKKKQAMCTKSIEVKNAREERDREEVVLEDVKQLDAKQGRRCSEPCVGLPAEDATPSGQWYTMDRPMMLDDAVYNNGK